MHLLAAFERVSYKEVNTMHTHFAMFSACSAVCPSGNNSVCNDTQRSINMSTVDRVVTWSYFLHGGRLLCQPPGRDIKCRIVEGHIGWRTLPNVNAILLEAKSFVGTFFLTM